MHDTARNAPGAPIEAPVRGLQHATVDGVQEEGLPVDRLVEVVVLSGTLRRRYDVDVADGEVALLIDHKVG